MKFDNLSDINIDELSHDEYNTLLKEFHKVSDRYVAIFEAYTCRKEMLQILDFANRLRIAGNDLVFEMNKKLEQLQRTKKYRNLIRLYGDTKKKKDTIRRKDYGKQLEALYKEYDVTWEHCRKKMQDIRKKYNIDSVFALTRAEDIWSGVEKCLYSNGERLHYIQRGKYPAIRAKQPNRGLVIKSFNNTFAVYFGKLGFNPLISKFDRFLKDENEAINYYLNNRYKVESNAIEQTLKGNIISTYRPCYASFVIKVIRGKPRLYIHMTLEGKSKPKYDKYGNQRHNWGSGRVGCDIGTQTIAITSDNDVVLKNLAERGLSIYENERREKRLQRAMERSRRQMNPQYYNEDGTIKKGRKKWKFSKRYLRLRSKYKELCRKNSLNKHYAINEDVNALRCKGNIIIVEPKNASKLMKKAKRKKNPDGTYKKRKRFGKSIKNRCPGYFQSQCKKVFEQSGGRYIEVPNNYRASQYEHTSDEYKKKKLSDRMFSLSNGDTVQRDLYSSFLLYNMNDVTNEIDKEQCIINYEKFKRMHDFEINYIRSNKIKVMNSGIAV